MELRIGTGGLASQSSKCPNSRWSLKQAQNLKHASIERGDSISPPFLMHGIFARFFLDLKLEAPHPSHLILMMAALHV